MRAAPRRPPGPLAAAWLVHAYTAAGLVVAAVAAVLIVRGDAAALRGAFLLFIVATALDASDGMLARRFRVRELIPSFDGRRLDDIIDYQTYTSLPLLLLWRADVLPGPLQWVLLVPLLASAYGFAQEQAKTDDGYFLGFPSFWNVIAFYLFFFRPPPLLSVAALLAFAALTVMPLRYLNPAKPGALNRIVAAAGVVWGALLVLILVAAVPPHPWVLISFAFPTFYMLASWTVPLHAPRARSA